MIQYVGNKATVTFANWWLKTPDAATILEETLDNHGWPDTDPFSDDFVACVKIIEKAMIHIVDISEYWAPLHYSPDIGDNLVAALLLAAGCGINYNRAATLAVTDYNQRMDKRVAAINARSRVPVPSIN